jgi:hypothetical protein
MVPVFNIDPFGFLDQFLYFEVLVLKRMVIDFQNVCPHNVRVISCSNVGLLRCEPKPFLKAQKNLLLLSLAVSGN